MKSCLRTTYLIIVLFFVSLLVNPSTVVQVPQVERARQGSVLIESGSFGIRGNIVFRIAEVQRGRPAARAGLRANDLVLAIEGREVTSKLEVEQTLLDSMLKPGKTFSITVGRVVPGTSELELSKVTLKAE